MIPLTSGPSPKRIFFVLFSFLVLAGAALFLFMTERDFIEKASRNDVGESAVPVDAEKADPKNEGRLVHVSGMTVSKDIVRDPAFDIRENAIALRSKSEMYQWVKRSKGQYTREWQEALQPRNPAPYGNPTSMSYRSYTQYTASLSVGGFSLAPGVIRKIEGFLPLGMDRVTPPVGFGEYGEFLYRGLGSPTFSRVGDIKISFSFIPMKETSIIAGQKGGTLEPYPTDYGPLVLIEDGSVPPGEMVEREAGRIAARAWLRRGISFFLMFVGFWMFQGGGARRSKAKRARTALRLSAGLSLLAAGASWLTVRPLAGMILLACGIGLFLLPLGGRRSLESSSDSSAF